jgi:uncharacterized membrane protein YvbJ
MICPQCGEHNPDDARYCGNCGASMRTIAPEPTSPEATNRPSVSKELKLGITVATVVVPIVGIVMGIIYMVDSDPAKKSAGRLWLSVAGIMFLIYCFLSLLTLDY